MLVNLLLRRIRSERFGSCELPPTCGLDPQAPPMRDDPDVPVGVTVETVIERPVSEVAAYASDPSNAPEWYANIKSVEWRTQPPLVVGSRMDFVATFLGRRLSYTYEVVEFVAGERLVMRTAQGPFPMETTYEWIRLEQGPDVDALV